MNVRRSITEFPKCDDCNVKKYYVLRQRSIPPVYDGLVPDAPINDCYGAQCATTAANSGHSPVGYEPRKLPFAGDNPLPLLRTCKPAVRGVIWHNGHRLRE